MNQDLTFADVVDATIDLTKDYIDDCQYRSAKDLTLEDVDYLASELQMGTEEFLSIIREYL